jgi:hypothetical protein
MNEWSCTYAPLYVFCRKVFPRRGLSRGHPSGWQGRYEITGIIGYMALGNSGFLNTPKKKKYFPENYQQFDQPSSKPLPALS